MVYNIHGVSFDADNCLFHAGYKPTQQEILSGQSKQVVTRNLPLLNNLRAQAKNFKETIVLVGSLRQSDSIDKFNAKKGRTESIFKAIPKVSNYIGATLNTFLLTDIYANYPPGKAFDCAVNHPKTQQAKCVADETKVSILYAQVHHLANLHPNETILFEFYDDRGCRSWHAGKDILEHLHDYFRHFPELLPYNVTLRLNHYEGAKVTPFRAIQGTGFIDANYQATTKEIAAISRKGAHTLPRIAPCTLHHRVPLLPQKEEKSTTLVNRYLGQFLYELGYAGKDICDAVKDIEQLPIRCDA